MTTQKTVRIEEFKGLDNRNPYNALHVQEKDVIKAYLKEAVNVDILTGFKAVRRAGAMQLDAAEFHSLWASPGGQIAFAVRGGQLGLLGRDYSHSPLVPVGERFVCYTEANHEIFMSDNAGFWVYDTTADAFEALTQAGTYQHNLFQLDMSEEAAYYSAPPPGYALAYGYGRLLVGNAYGLFFSQFGFPRRFNEENDFVPFENLTVIGVVDDGIYLGADGRVYFLAGDNIKKQNFKLVSHYSAVRGTLLHTEANKFGIEGASGRAVIWETEEGKVLGLNSGRVFNLTQDHVSYAVAELGASFIRELNGQRHHISTFMSPGAPVNRRATDLAVAESEVAATRWDQEGFTATDTVIAEVRRNGVII